MAMAVAVARWLLASALTLLAAADDNDLFSSTFEMRRLYLTELQFATDVFEYADLAEKHAQAVRKAVAYMYPDGPPKVRRRNSLKIS